MCGGCVGVCTMMKLDFLEEEAPPGLCAGDALLLEDAGEEVGMLQELQAAQRGEFVLPKSMETVLVVTPLWLLLQKRGYRD